MAKISEQSLAQLVIGVADIGLVRGLWVARFGFEIVAACRGPDAALEKLWGLRDGQVEAQLLLRTPGATTGWLHFVQFADPAPPVRRGASPTDYCPKNIDVNCVDMPARRAELLSDGVCFRSNISEYQIGDIVTREVQAPVHDDINLVLIEVFDWPIKLSSLHYGGVTSFVLAIPDLDAESQFYRDALGLDILHEHRVAGKAIEAMIGLPPGGALNLRIMGSEQQFYGRLELIEYEGLPGRNLFPAAHPPALGSLHGRFQTDDLEGLVKHLRSGNIEVREYGEVDMLFGQCRVVSLKSPAGFGIEIFELLS
jgi:hypothetical protein